MCNCGKFEKFPARNKKDEIHGKYPRNKRGTLYRPRKRWYSNFEDDIDYSRISLEEVFHDRDSLEVDEVSLENLEEHVQYGRKVLDKVYSHIQRLYSKGVDEFILEKAEKESGFAEEALYS